MVFCVILNVSQDTKELDLFAGRTVQIISETTELFAISLRLMDEEPVTHYGIRENVKEKIVKDVRGMD